MYVRIQQRGGQSVFGYAERVGDRVTVTNDRENVLADLSVAFFVAEVKRCRIVCSDESLKRILGP